MIGTVVMLIWLVGGVVMGMVAANLLIADDGDGFNALLLFVGCVVGAPLIAAAAAVGGLAWCGAWLLPAFRARRRTGRLARRWSAEQSRRAEVDRLHAELGLPPVDWEGRA